MDDPVGSNCSDGGRGLPDGDKGGDNGWYIESKPFLAEPRITVLHQLMLASYPNGLVSLSLSNSEYRETMRVALDHSGRVARYVCNESWRLALGIYGANSGGDVTDDEGEAGPK